MQTAASPSSATAAVWWFYERAAFFAALNLLCAWIVVRIVRARKPALLSERFRGFLVIGGALFLMIAGTGGLGWTIQTWGGNSPPEKLNQTLLQVFAHVGTFMVFVDLLWNFIEKREKKGS
jgi:hypothetical protein